MDRTHKDSFLAKKLYRFYRNENRMPSYSEAAKIFGFKSKAGAFKALGRLASAGLVGKSSGKIVPRQKMIGTKILGLVEADFPTFSEENLLDSVTLDSYLIRNSEATFMLKVKGDSMQEAGILDSDMVLVEQTSSAKPGQIVVAEVDGAWTMKYLRKGKKGFYLEPANQKYKPIFPKEELRIRAVVIAVIRKYNEPI